MLECEDVDGLGTKPLDTLIFDSNYDSNQTVYSIVWIILQWNYLQTLESRLNLQTQVGEV